MRRHIVDMGITPGTEIRIVKAAPMGDPIEIALRGYSMSLRKADAATILLMEEAEHETFHKAWKGRVQNMRRTRMHCLRKSSIPAIRTKKAMPVRQCLQASC